MLDQFDRLHTETAQAVAGLHPDELSVAEADRVLAALTAMATLVAAGELLVMSRAVEADTKHAAKERLARRGGISGGEAESLMKASEGLHTLPVVADALRAGRLSRAQTRIVVDTAAAVPSSQSELLDAAATQDLKGLRDRCAIVRSRNDRNPGETRDRQRRARALRMWKDKDGCHHGHWCLPPESAAEFEGTLEQWVDLVLRHASADGDPATVDNRRADALLAMARASVRQRSKVAHRPTEDTPSGDTVGRTPGPATDPPPDRPGPEADGWLDALPVPIAKEVVVVIDILTLAAAMAGVSDHLAPDRDGQICELRGFGPVAPQVAALFMEGDPFLKAVLTEGCDVRIVKHFGRKVPAHFLTGWRLNHSTCADPGCNNCRGLEGDHVIPDALDGPISMATFEPKCRSSHREKTKVDITTINAARTNGFRRMTTQERAARNRANRTLAFDPDPGAYQRFLDLEQQDAHRRESAVPISPSHRAPSPPGIRKSPAGGQLEPV